MGASPTPMAFGEVYTSLQTGVIDGFEHDASTTLPAALLRGRALHGAHAPHRRRARALGLGGRPGSGFPRSSGRSSSRRSRGRAPPARDGSRREDRSRDGAARGAGHDDPRDRPRRLPAGRRGSLAKRGAGARTSSPGCEALALSARCRARSGAAHRGALDWSTAPGRRARRGRRAPGRRPPPAPHPAARGPRRSRGCCSSG